MGLTNQSTGSSILGNSIIIDRSSCCGSIIALSGNPNVGKSTVFNSLTGLNQHTGNWPGKTVTTCYGKYRHKSNNFILVDIPGTYSLMANSAEEEVARDFVCFENPDATVVVTDATCLERNLNLVLQTLEITDNVVVCVNLIDEAERKKIHINCKKLSERLGVPVIATNARSKMGLGELIDAVYNIALGFEKTNPLEITYDETIEQAIELIRPVIREVTDGKISDRWVSLKLLDGDASMLESLNKFLGFNISDNSTLQQSLDKARRYLEQNGIHPDHLRDRIVSRLINISEEICRDVVSFGNKQYNQTDRKIDSILTSKFFGLPVMLALLAVIFWLTITGANYPSGLLANLLFGIEDKLTDIFISLNVPGWIHGALLTGTYRTLAWVVSVMLPPMAIFFPLFTLLEDLGYLPRVAFNLDNFFKKACAHGKQALTMCMGFGCNAAGVIGCRIIDSPRERLIATITNTFVPCNGRFPTLIALSAIFIGGMTKGASGSLVSTLSLTAVVLL